MEGLHSVLSSRAAVCINVLLIFSAIHMVSGEQAPLKYTIQENDPNLLIADLITDYKLAEKHTQSEINNMSFVFIENEQKLSSLFTVNKGLLEVKSSIDRDNICPGSDSCIIKLDIKIQPFQFFQIIKVEVQVEDMNDNAPRFATSTEDLSVSESTRVGTKLALPVAVDSDSPVFGVQLYEIQPSSDAFRLVQDSTSTGQKIPQLEIMKDLDREKQDLYTFELRALDGGSPIELSTIAININILDSNDNSPVFIKDNFVVSVNESIPVGSSIIQVEAEDKDTGPNGVVTYSFDTNTDAENGHLFRVDEKTGRVFVKAQLDFEDNKQHVLTVLARDNNPDYSGATAIVTINVRDVNDNRPSIKVNDHIEGTSLEVPENYPLGYFVAHLTVVDLDSGANGQFSCVIDNTEDFTLERLYPTEFKLTTAKLFDRETISQYVVQITCQDKGDPALKSSKIVPVVVTDVNDERPKFTTNAFVGNVRESTQVGTVLMRVTASDPDSGPNGEVEYFIEDAYKGKFSIDSASGNITLKQPLDHEVENRPQFVVTAIDKGNPRLSSNATVIIDVIDEDDNLPVFVPPNKKLFVLEHSLPRTEVGKVKAVDADSDLFNKFTYELEDNSFFTIDPYSGMIYTSRDIDREDTSVFNLNVYAVTSTSNPTTSTGMVTVTINDINDYNPVFIFPTPKNNTIHVPTSLTRGEIVTYIKSTDQDMGDNARLSYTIIGGNSENYFVVDSNIGAIMVHRSLDSIELQSFGLVIRVQDGGLPPRTSEAYLNIIVNRSLTGARTEAVGNQNITIAISIACISGLIMVLLVIAIAVIVKQRKANPKSRMYNYTPKVMDRNAYLNGGKSPSETSVNTQNDVIKGFTNYVIEQEVGSPTSQSTFANDHKVDGYAESEADSACSADTDSGRGSNEDFSHEQIRHASDSSHQYGGHDHHNSQHHRHFNKPDLVAGTRQTNPLYGVPSRLSTSSQQQQQQQQAARDINTQHLPFGTHMYQHNSSNVSNSSSSEQMYRDRRRDLLYRESHSPSKLSPVRTVPSDENKYLQLSNAHSTKTKLHEVHV